MTKIRMTKKLRDKWVKALRGGRYTQIKSKLKGLVGWPGEKKKYGYCCLGVLCTVARIDMSHTSLDAQTFGYLYQSEGSHLFGSGVQQVNTTSLTKHMRKKLGLLESHQKMLIKMNDEGDGSNFGAIADYIEKHVPLVEDA